MICCSALLSGHAPLFYISPIPEAVVLTAARSIMHVDNVNRWVHGNNCYVVCFAFNKFSTNKWHVCCVVLSMLMVICSVYLHVHTFVCESVNVCY